MTTSARIEAIVQRLLGPLHCPTITPDTKWTDPAIGFDSLDRLELVMECEDEFHITIPDGDVDNPANETFGGLVAYIEAKLVKVDA